MKKKTNILWHNKIRSWIQSEELVFLRSNQNLLIQAMYSFISQGTEKIVLTNELSDKTAANMSVPYMKGALSETFTFGYSVVGQVIDGTEEMLGKYVHVMHPHQDVFVTNIDNVFTIPEKIDLKTATLASNLETAVNAVWDAQLDMGDKIQIIGYGIIGSLIAKLVSQIPGISLDIKEINSQRVQLAKDHGYRASNESLYNDYDIVFNTSSGRSTLQEAINDATLDGAVVELSWYGAQSVTLDLGSDFHYGRKKIISSQVSHIPSHKQPRWNYKNRKGLVFKLLQDLDFSDLLSADISFLETPSFFNKLRRGEVFDHSTIINY